MKNLIVLFAFLSVIIGLYSFTYLNDVFADSLKWCCNNAGCENTNPEESPLCSSTSSFWTGSEEIDISCRNCVDFTISGCVPGTGSWYCINADGSFYYGQLIGCPQE